MSHSVQLATVVDMAYGYQSNFYQFGQPSYQWPQTQYPATENTTGSPSPANEGPESSDENELVSLTVKLICPKEKRGEHRVFILRDINLSEITSLDSMRKNIYSQFGKKFIDNSADFDVGYFEGTKRIWIRTNEDLNKLLQSIRTKSITLWCTGRKRGDKRGRVTSGSSSDSEEDFHRKRKKKKKGAQEERNDRVDELVDELRDKHGESFSNLQYRVWAETVLGGHHKSLDKPPKGSYYKKRGASSPLRSVDNPPSTVITPIRAAELKTTYIKQIKDLHSLLDIGAITKADFEKQKHSILKLMDNL